ncbi:HlyD family type I secretion periplasmic adaptor subunit [Magnetospirillum gryphiswaldense]|uniref:Membrane fusion protein (MFP) family protein n=2 Tax=Magnetospirillum gryphiswaldense TaxID=55518 RepID=V6F1U0_MAGGM|nr:HlyD family type I secretion periplasmic adaptor subunit [Magnetospirillum gryphiswaldense]AVM74762.1 Type I secretion system membrane fusion protein PrsE [Magnetospirillum gryphiswaldense MSR-1]AVM78665.1 Type I secretion system membrane fusion protein PrsE [Magnetospirillum gryphiswaldense]CAM77161.1 Type I secretion membrane fusion protein, HlyD [Magnetospirillum gryphiswaldense MSR-1]CDK99495.1 Type I secretion membrane fusion protein [Magnetospirillum gryphiswaldense MSR-1 v2]
MSEAAALTPTPSPMGPPKLEKATRQIRHLAQFAIVEESGISAVSRAAVIIVSAVVAAFIVWASFMRIDEVAVTFGTAVPSRSVQVVQHLEGGIVREILVEDRAMVEAGQVLVRLDPIQASAELEQAQSRRAGLAIKSERLRAFVENRQPDFSGFGVKYAPMIVDQLDILRANTERWSSQRKVFEEQIMQKREEIRAAQNQQRSAEEQLKLVSEEVGMREQLYNSGYSSKVDFYAVRRQRAAVEAELSRLKGQEATAAKALEELAKRIGDLDNNIRQDTLGELGTVSTELVQVEESMSRLHDRVNRLEIVSPAKGFVQNLKAKTVGAVVPAGGMLMEIVPVDDELLVETRISTRDVGHLHSGQKVIIKVASYDFVRFGSVEGTLRDISATTYVDEKDNQPYYKGWVLLQHPYVGTHEGQNRILPGMTVQADIITGDKTLLQYLLKPLQASFSQAFRER